MKTITDSDLVRALRPFRPDPEDFRRRVEEKLAAREAELEATPVAVPAGWRSAAAILPLGMFHPKFLAAPALAAGKQLGAKGSVAVLAWPVLSIAMLALAFAGTLRAAARIRTGAAATRAAADEAIRGWWKAHTGHAIATLAVLLVLAATQPAEAVVLVLLVSMLFVTGTLVSLSKAGAASPASVGGFTSGFLSALLVLAMVFRGFAAGLRTQHVPEFWVPFVILTGAVACDAVGRWDRDASRARRILAAGVSAVLVLLTAAFLTTRVRPVDTDDMAGFVREFDRPLTDTVHWRSLGHVGEWLQEEAPDVLDRATPRRLVAESFEAGGWTPGIQSTSVRAAARFDAVPEEVWEAVRGEPEATALLEVPGPIHHASAVELWVRALVREPLTEAQRDHLAERLRGGWPQPDAALSLETMVNVCELLELLERPLQASADAADHAADAHRALVLRWRGRVLTRPYAAGFVSDPGVLSSRHVADLFQMDATDAAVELMRRFGAPEEIDVSRVEAFLRRVATPSVVEALAPGSIDLLTVQHYRYRAASALAELRKLPAAERDEPTLAQVVASEHILIGAVLLVALSLFATVRSARPAPAS